MACGKAPVVYDGSNEDSRSDARARTAPVRIPAYRVFARFLLGSFFLCEPLLAQLPTAASPSSPVGTARSAPERESSSVDLDIYLQEPDSTSVGGRAALTLLTAAGQPYRQGVTNNGHLRWEEVAQAKYEIQVIAPGFERALQPVDATRTGELRVDVRLRRQTGEVGFYPPVSSDGEVNYVFGLYASRSGGWERAKSYWTEVLALLPDHVAAMVSISEALLRENKAVEAMEYLVRAEKIDSSYWRTHAVLAEIALRAGSAGEAVVHAERAMELGREEAATVSPLLARALVDRANELLRTYLEDHPEDLAARKQLAGLNPPLEPHTSEPPNVDARVMSSDPASAEPAPRAGNNRWLPADVDDHVPPVEAGTACNLDEVLEKAGQRIQEFVGNVDRFTATESLVHETLRRSGNVSTAEKRKYDYVVSITEVRPGILDLQEYERSGSAPADSPGGMTTRGLSALALIFHPYYSDTFSMRCEGIVTLHGIRSWQIYFRQRKDKPNRIRSFRADLKRSYPVDLKGRAWIVADSHQIIGLETDLIEAIPDVRLTAEHTAIHYGPVHFSSRGLDMWLPQIAEVYMELRGKRLHRRISFSNYLLFAVDDKQQIAAPKPNP